MPSSANVDEKHGDAASVRSTSTMSSLKSLLHKKRDSTSKTIKPTQAQKAHQNNTTHEARAAYFVMK